MLSYPVCDNHFHGYTWPNNDEGEHLGHICIHIHQLYRRTRTCKGKALFIASDLADYRVFFKVILLVLSSLRENPSAPQIVHAKETEQVKEQRSCLSYRA